MFILTISTLTAILGVLLCITLFAPEKQIAVWKVRFEVVAIVSGGVFVAATWGVETYWARLPQFQTNFWDYRAEGSTEPKYLRAKPFGGQENSTHCRFRGQVNIYNKGKVPIYLEDTYVFVERFNTKNICGENEPKDADGKCIGGRNVSDVYKKLCDTGSRSCSVVSDPDRNPKDLKSKASAEINPVDGNLLTAETPANRPFEFVLKDWKAGEDLLVVAVTQVGMDCRTDDSIRKETSTDWLNGPQSCELMNARFVYQMDALPCGVGD